MGKYVMDRSTLIMKLYDKSNKIVLTKNSLDAIFV